MKTILLFICLFVVNYTYSQSVTVPTQRYDNSRLGWNSKETVLNSTNVNSNTFGLKFSRQVDDHIYAQPLIVSNLLINSSLHNVVFVATVSNSVYAFDAEDPAAVNPLWHINLTPSGTRNINTGDYNGAPLCPTGYHDFAGKIGIVGTPVIDTLSFTMYLVSRDIKISTGEFEQFLHAIDIRTGADKAGSPVLITAVSKGRGDGSVNSRITFNPMTQNQRAALALFNGEVYICWGAHCDLDPYHGWVMGFDENTLQLKHVYNDSPDGGEGGIWMSGNGPCIDSNGFIYVTTGNGSVGSGGPVNESRNLSESVLKLQPSGDTLRVVDFFIPNNFATLINRDMDYGVDGIIILPNTNLSLSGSKEGKIYVLNTNHLGKFTAGNDSVIQTLFVNTQTGTPDIHVHGTPVYYKFTNQVDSEFVYAWAESDTLKQFPFNRSLGMFDVGKVKKGNVSLEVGMPGAMLSVSSNGQLKGTGVIWASHPQSGDANHAVRPGTLEAFDASDVSKSLWSSDQVPRRDSVGQFAKFNCPVVANGKVYLGTFSNRLNVYGLIPPDTNALPTPWINTNIGVVGATGSASFSGGAFTVKGSGVDIWDNADGCKFVYQPMSGDGNIVAKVVSQTNTNVWAKAGVMIRGALTAGATEVSTVITPANGVNFLSRSIANGISASISGAAVTVPYWVKIERIGSTFNSYSSPNGTTWTKIGSVTISMGNNVFIGMCVTSHNDGVLSSVVFDHVAVTNIPTDVNNIALNKPATSSSIEKAGLEANKANDGDASTRWSSAFSDPQWIAIDLQGFYNITQVKLIWEAAFAQAYHVEVSNDNVNWTVAKSVTNGAGGTETWNFSGVFGRYIRMFGITRATEFGYSLFEFKAFGTLNLPPVANPGANQTITLPVSTASLNGSASNDPDGTITNYSWAQVSGPNTATLTNANTVVANVSNMIAGTYIFSLIVTDNGGLTATSNVTITLNVPSDNIALNKPATSSSVEKAGLEAAMGNDGNLTTRWSSAFSDPQWMEVDLQAFYNITKVVLVWEAAFGQAYHIEVSNDNINWTVAKSVTNGAGGTETWNLSGVNGRYIRMFGITRGTEFGYSLFEFEAFGSLVNGNLPPVANPGANQTITLPLNTVSLNGSLSNDPDGTITNYSWAQVSGPNTATLINGNTAIATANNLTAGTYVFGLTVTDNGGLTAGNNVNVTVNDSTALSNIALHKPATSSSIEDVGFEATKANDSIFTTRWSSNFGNNEWIKIDLQATYTITKVVFIWEASFGQVYNIEVSNDNAHWTIAKAVTNGAGGTETYNFSGVSGRYIRMLGILRGTRFGYSMWEFQVFGSLLKSSKLFDPKKVSVEVPKMSVFPNPFTGLITINLKGDVYHHAKIFDTEGRLLDQWDIEPGATMVSKDLGNLGKGIYLLKLEGLKGSEITRIIKY